MPTDNRRLPTPDVSLNPLLFCSSKTSALLFDKGVRCDGREECELRAIRMACDVVTQATGSAYVEVGQTKVICAVHGPKDIEQKEDFKMSGKISCEFKFAPFSCKKRREHIPSNEENELSSLFTQTLKSVICLDKFPKSQIEVYIIVKDNGGSVLSTAFMAASLALANASIDTYDIITACTVRVIGKEVILVDTNEDEEQLTSVSEDNTDNGLVTVAVLPTMNQVPAILSSGVMSCDVLCDAMDRCIDSAQSRYDTIRDFLIMMMKSESEANVNN